MQRDYISSFNQSEHCFVGSSLPLPSSLIKLSMDSFRREQEEISYAEGNEAIEEDRGLKERAEKTQDGRSLLGGEVLVVGSTMQPGDDTKVLDLKPVEIGTVLGPLLLWP